MFSMPSSAQMFLAKNMFRVQFKSVSPDVSHPHPVMTIVRPGPGKQFWSDSFVVFFFLSSIPSIQSMFPCFPHLRHGSTLPVEAFHLLCPLAMMVSTPYLWRAFVLFFIWGGGGKKGVAWQKHVCHVLRPSVQLVRFGHGALLAGRFVVGIGSWMILACFCFVPHHDFRVS